MILVPIHSRIVATVICLVFFGLTATCKKSSLPTTNESNAPAKVQEVPVAESAPPPIEIDASVLDRLKSEKRHGDLSNVATSGCWFHTTKQIFSTTGRSHAG
jgi:hypothetical protein